MSNLKDYSPMSNQEQAEQMRARQLAKLNRERASHLSKTRKKKATDEPVPEQRKEDNV